MVLQDQDPVRIRVAMYMYGVKKDRSSVLRDIQKSWKLPNTKTEVDFVCCMTCICVHVHQQLCYVE